MREPVDLCERDRGLECLRCARGRHAREPGDGAVDSTEALLDHSAEELRLRIVRREPERRVEVGVRLDELSKVEMRAATAEPRGEAAARLREHRAGRVHGAGVVALREQALEVGRCRRALGHARRIRRDGASSTPNAHRPRVGGGGVKSVGS